MKQIYNMYRMVRIINRCTLEVEKENEGGDLVKVLSNPYPTIQNVRTSYKEKYKCSRSEVSGAYEDTIKMGYAREIPKKFKNLNIPHYVVVTTKGRELTDSFIVPWGLILALAHRYGAVASLFISLGIGAAISTLAHIAIKLVRVWLNFP